MLTHTPPPNGGAPPYLDALADELRAIYQQAFTPALERAINARERFETADGTAAFDPVFAADTAASRTVNQAMPAAIARHLPDAQLIESIDEPAVIDSRWQCGSTIVVVEWDYTRPFGDAGAPTVREVAQ